MLQKLHIQNYAIIDELEIVFSSGLNIITGETGAGKSILMGALSLILGERADSSALLNRDKKCVVEAFFTVADQKAVRRFLKEQELDAEDELIVRREIAASGKSRAFINDTPVNLEQLRGLSDYLADLHRQFDTLELGESDFQREVLDALATNAERLNRYQQTYRQWQEEKRALEALQLQQQQFNKETDYNQYLYDELAEAGFAENELEEAEQELKILSHSEAMKAALGNAAAALQEGETPLTQQLKVIVQQLQAYTDFHSAIPEIKQRLLSAQVELVDIAGEIDRLNNQVQHDAQRIEQLNDRMATGYKLLKKHGVQSTNELRDLQHALEEKLQAVLHIDEAIAAKQQSVAALEATATEQAAALSTRRTQQAAPLAEKVNKLLAQVGMPNACLQVQVKQDVLTTWGCDVIDFLFDANKSGQLMPIRKVASGGELSRLMLCIKSLVAQSVNLPTMIFDEIDTGISGEAARQVGIIMKGLAARRQLISITHQPQIAGKADAHFFVYKEIKGDAIKTNIRQLSQEERITTIAQMLSGEKPTAAALANAREMVMN